MASVTSVAPQRIKTGQRSTTLYISFHSCHKWCTCCIVRYVLWLYYFSVARYMEVCIVKYSCQYPLPVVWGLTVGRCISLTNIINILSLLTPYLTCVCCNGRCYTVNYPPVLPIYSTCWLHVSYVCLMSHLCVVLVGAIKYITQCCLFNCKSCETCWYNIETQV